MTPEEIDADVEQMMIVIDDVIDELTPADCVQWLRALSVQINALADTMEGDGRPTAGPDRWTVRVSTPGKATVYVHKPHRKSRRGWPDPLWTPDMDRAYTWAKQESAEAWATGQPHACDVVAIPTTA
jgi:hypothetical protein